MFTIDKYKWSVEMSKGRVWNKGKRNSGGGPVEGSKELAEAKAQKKIAHQQADSSSTESIAGETENPINRVARMNRENWVVRPTRVKPEHNDK
jgi:hypothetical protein